MERSFIISSFLSHGLCFRKFSLNSKFLTKVPLDTFSVSLQFVLILTFIFYDFLEQFSHMTKSDCWTHYIIPLLIPLSLSFPHVARMFRVQLGVKEVNFQRNDDLKKYRSSILYNGFEFDGKHKVFPL